MKKFLLKLLSIFVKEKLEEELQDDSPATPEPMPPQPEPEPDEPSEFPQGLQWLGPNISNWKESAVLTASVGGTRINLKNNAAWPTMRTRASDGGPLMGNAWVIAEVGGQWYAATWEWMRQGQQFKAKRSLHGDHIKRGEFGPHWTPKSGQRIGLMISTGARNSERTTNERSNISWVVWP